VDVATGADLSPPGRHEERAETVVFSSDGRRALTASGGDGFVWNTESGELVGSAPYFGRALSTITLSPDGERATVYQDQGLHVWEIGTGRVEKYPQLLEPSTFAWTNDGRAVVLAIGTRPALHTLGGAPVGVTFQAAAGPLRDVRQLADGRLAGATQERGYVWDADGRISVEVVLPEIPSWAGRRVATSRDGRAVAAYGGGTVCAFAALTDPGTTPSSVPSVPALFTIPERFGRASNHGRGLSAEFLADGRLLVAACRGEPGEGELCVARVWEAVTGLQVWESPEFLFGIAEVVFALGGRVLAVALDDATTVLFEVPVRPVALDPTWRTSDAMALARGIAAQGAFDRAPILADALQDAGCADEDVLDHLRSGSPERARWVVDLVLGKQ
jgi:hypothetical protein